MNFKKSFGAALNVFKSQYIPVKDEDCRLTWGGAVAVPNKSNKGTYLAFDPSTNKLMSYPAGMTLPFPVYFINKSVEQIQKGDVIKHGTTYLRVNGVKDGKIHADSYTGYNRNVLPITDFLLGSATIPVAMNLFGAFGNGATNPFTAFGNMQSNPFGMILMSQMFSGSDEDEDIVDEFTNMDRHDLKLYQQKNSLGIRVVPSMEDEDLRNAIRKALGRKTSAEGDTDGMVKMMAMSSMFSGGTMNPIAMAMMMDKKGSDSDDLMLILLMQSLQGQQQPAAAVQEQPTVVAEAPQENDNTTPNE